MNFRRKVADLAAARKVLAARSQHDNGHCRIGLGPLASGLRGHGIEAYVLHPTSVGVPREHRRAKTDPVPSLLKPDSLIYCDGLFTILARGESYPYKTQAFRTPHPGPMIFWAKNLDPLGLVGDYQSAACAGADALIFVFGLGQPYGLRHSPAQQPAQLLGATSPVRP